MSRLFKCLLLLAITLPAGLSLAAEAKKEGILPKVEKPIPDTYAPLDGADWNHRTSDELRQLREFQKLKEEQAETEQRMQLREELDAKIQAPDPGAPQAAAQPVVEESENQLRIRDPE